MFEKKKNKLVINCDLIQLEEKRTIMYNVLF